MCLDKLSVALFLVLCGLGAANATGTCIPLVTNTSSTYHFNEPQQLDLPGICGIYSDETCCSTSVANAINDPTNTSLYLFDQAHCGPLSPACQVFLQIEECLYECSPNLGPFAVAGEFGPELDGVPVCQEFCDAWFDACKDDFSCATNWLDFSTPEGFNFTEDGIVCRDDSTCLTYAERYGDGTGLCNTMWASTFTPSSDLNTCQVFHPEWELLIAEANNEDLEKECIPKATGGVNIQTFHLFEPMEVALEGVCGSYSSESCCSAETAASIDSAQATELYNFDFGHCQGISRKCEAFLQMEQCFYECSPDLGPYTKPGFDGFPFLDSIPICANLCDAWFEACRFEMTCAENWLDFTYPDGFNVTEDGIVCFADSECRTYEEVYQNGEGLCEKMWGTSFVYSPDPDVCRVFQPGWEAVVTYAALLDEREAELAQALSDLSDTQDQLLNLGDDDDDDDDDDGLLIAILIITSIICAVAIITLFYVCKASTVANRFTSGSPASPPCVSLGGKKEAEMAAA